jgi:hypothetical protein
MQSLKRMRVNPASFYWFHAALLTKLQNFGIPTGPYFVDGAWTQLNWSLIRAWQSRLEDDAVQIGGGSIDAEIPSLTRRKTVFFPIPPTDPQFQVLRSWSKITNDDVDAVRATINGRCLCLGKSGNVLCHGERLQKME